MLSFWREFQRVRERTLCVYAGYDLNGDFARKFDCNEVGLRPIRAGVIGSVVARIQHSMLLAAKTFQDRHRVGILHQSRI